jgi:nucleoid-associated protein YgaU
MKSLKIFLASMLIVSTASAQEKNTGDSFPFEDFPDFDAGADKSNKSTTEEAPEENLKSAAAPSIPKKKKKSEEEIEEAPPFSDEELAATASESETAPPIESALPEESAPPEAQAKSVVEEPVQDDVVTPAPDQLTVTAPAAPDPLLSQPTNTEDFGDGQESLMSSGAELPDDVKALEVRLQNAEAQYGEERARQEGLGDPGEGLAPSDKFSRVPLRPPMSDANWLRWAGPMAQKDYKVRRGDSLWAVSDRLFGNPYLWPKIWHLNARITNPHLIEKGMTLSFSPGNPGSAPELAFRPDSSDVGNVGLHPLTKLDKKRTLLELIDETLRTQISSSHPPFQHFMLDRKPEVIGRIPDALMRTGRKFLVEGDRFRLNLGDGVYPIVKMTAVTENFVRGYRVRWTGLVSVRDRQAEIVKAFTEIEKDDEIVNRRFQLSPLAVHKDIIGPEYRNETAIVTLDEGAQSQGATGQMMGVLFPGIGLGPRPGALLEVQVGANRKVQALLIDRDQRFGTLWIVESEQEMTTDDKLF